MLYALLILIINISASSMDDHDLLDKWKKIRKRNRYELN